MPDSALEQMRKTSHLSGGSFSYIETMYEQYVSNPNAVPEVWRSYFHSLPVDSGVGVDISHRTIVHQFEQLGRNRFKARPEKDTPEELSEHERKQIKVLELINAYRSLGHRKADLDPLDMWERDPCEELELNHHKLTVADLDTVFSTGSSQFFESDEASLSEIISALEQTYCASIGAEYMHITDEQEQMWLRHRLEAVHSNVVLEDQHRLQILERLLAADGLEKYLHNRYPGTKRFGLEGAEVLIPMLHETLQRLGHYDTVEVVIGMAHRGRLNVLVNILGKHASDLFDEFEGHLAFDEYSGDVKYHQGFSSNVTTKNGEMHVALAFNPSHLEIVGPVVEGSVRARLDRRRDPTGSMVVPILVHGDAAFAGQGVVMETFQMSQTRGYFTGGTIHIILNNQIGFTTSAREDARSTEYCSEIAKLVRAPVLHVNGDDPEAVVFAAQTAVDYRSLFGRDFVIDVICYRRRGHNEAEDPTKTQPLMYQRINEISSITQIYSKQLVAEGLISSDEVKQMTHRMRDRLDAGETIALGITSEPDSSLFVDWRPYLDHEWTDPADTTVSVSKLQELCNHVHEFPQGFVVHRQVQKIIEDRKRMAAGAAEINWGFGEIMAYATLLDDGFDVRLTGQDVGVGTFSHRHACMYCQKSGERITPLNAAFEDRTFAVYDSLLSEEAVLAFEYGYATTSPTTLCIWEAQFGDFANGAQVVIDQFVSSGEAKWQRLCGLVMYLPHGYEGAGPEHSSARLERYLQLCAEKNIQVCIPTTPAQIFHLIRRQMLRPMRRPLIVLTPKSLLRHKSAVSTLDELAAGKFECILREVDDLNPREVKKLLLCSGKVFYELYAERAERGLTDTTIVRIEQLYPFPHNEVEALLHDYTNLEKIVWVQEEPQNQGAWYSTKHHIDDAIEKFFPDIELQYAGRLPYAAPAGGNSRRHNRNQVRLINDAFAS